MKNLIKILVVDDDSTLRETLQEIIKEEFEVMVDTASNGEEALNYLTEQLNNEMPYNLVLTDNSMPRMTGCEMIKAYRELDMYNKTRFIMMTGDEILKSSVPVIHKPFKPEELIDQIKIYINP